MENFIILLDGNNFESDDENILANVIASPILKTTPRIIPEDDILLNYSVKFPYFEGKKNNELLKCLILMHFNIYSIFSRSYTHSIIRKVHSGLFSRFRSNEHPQRKCIASNAIRFRTTEISSIHRYLNDHQG